MCIDAYAHYMGAYTHKTYHRLIYSCTHMLVYYIPHTHTRHTTLYTYSSYTQPLHITSANIHTQHTICFHATLYTHKLSRYAFVHYIGSYTTSASILHYIHTPHIYTQHTTLYTYTSYSHTTCHMLTYYIIYR